MSDPITNLQDARKIVERRDLRDHGHLSTGDVLDRAAELLLTWWTAAAEHGNATTDYRSTEWAWSLASVAHEMAGQRALKPGDVTEESARALLDAVAEKLTARGIAAKRVGYAVPMPRTSDTPRLGRDGIERLAITFTIDRGWNLIIDQPQGSPVFTIVGDCNEAGIDAMLNLAIAVNNGAFGNVFARSY